MKALFIAIGNSLRRDDGVAQAVVERLTNVESRVVLQLTPELADDIKSYEVVVFIDADASLTEVRIERLDGAPSQPPSTHATDPASLIKLSQTVFGFAGQAYLCRVPVEDLGVGEGLSEQAASHARKAANALCKAQF